MPYPLVEVITEFHYPENVYSDEKANQFKNVIKELFSTHKEVSVVSHELKMHNNAASSQTKTHVRDQYYSTDDLYVVQIDKSLLAINHRAPYTNWNNFKSKIDEVWGIFNSIFGDCCLHLASLHYMNIINLQGDRIDIDEYLNFRPAISEDFIKCSCEATLVWNEENCYVTKQMNTLEPDLESKSLPIALNLSTQKKDINTTDILRWLEAAHSFLDLQFKNSITDKTRNLFKEG